jgi:hypothetical protein
MILFIGVVLIHKIGINIELMDPTVINESDFGIFNRFACSLFIYFSV